MKNNLLSLLTVVAAALAPPSMTAAPQVPCAAITRYASVTDPRTIAFAPDGSLYVGRDNSGSGGFANDPVKIHRIGPGGSPVTEYGATAISDPDGVVFDAAGTVSGLAGSVVVGSGRKFSRIAPNGAVTILHTNATFPGNPTKMIFDGPGRMLFADQAGLGVMTSATPQLLTNTGPLYAVALDSLDRIVASRDFSPSGLMLLSSSGALLNATFAAAELDSPLARGPGGAFWGTDIIAVSPAGDLIRVDTNGASITLGTGFLSAHDLAFGPDGALYVSMFSTDEILRVTPLPRPEVPGMTVECYASVTDPQIISVAPNGVLYAGRDNSGSGGTSADAVKISRVGPCGSPVTEYGNAAIADPDAVIFDAAGIVSGIPGSVLVGGQTTPGVGAISRIAPNGTVSNLFGPSSLANNPTKFTFASPGRLLCLDFGSGNILVMTNATAQVFFTAPASSYSLALDGLGRVLVSSGTGNQVRLYSATGVLLSNVFVTAQPRSPLARGPGGVWGTNVYFVATNGNLRSVSPSGVVTEHGTGFAPFEDMVFGPDDALYLSDLESDTIVRVRPPGHQPVPLHWWRGDGDALDSVGVEHGTVNGPVTFEPGRFGQAFTFRTNNAFQASVTLGTNAGNFGAGDFTIALWVRIPSNTPGLLRPLTKRATCNHHSFWSVNVSTNGGGLEVDQNSAGDNYFGIPTTNGFVDNQWHHLAFVRSGTRLTSYLDAALHRTLLTNGVTYLSNAAPLTVASSVCSQFGVTPFFGQVDDIRFYGCALDQTQVAAMAALPDPTVPRLHIARLPGAAVQLSWTTNAPGFVLQTNGPSFAPGAWNALGTVPAVTGTHYVVTNAVDSPAQNYRLRKP